MKSGKVAWECSHDLSACVEKEVLQDGGLIFQRLQRNPAGISITELGCGKGIPLCAALLALDRFGFTGSVNITLQDMDASTIESVTKPYVESVMNKLSAQFLGRVRVEFVVSRWDSLEISRNSQDVILSSECIYRDDLFPSHAEVIAKSLSPDGVALVAGKRYYFGCGGGTIDFSCYLNEHYPEFKVGSVSVFENGMSNTREILSVFKSY